MTLAELCAGLTARKAAIIHFSHYAVMRDWLFYPDDLQAAITHKDDWPLCCSVLWPNHNIKSCGDVGVIFWPNDVTNVLDVNNQDSGSDGDVTGGAPLTLETFKNTFSVAEGYNEWRMRGADVVGIFVREHRNIWVKRKQRMARNECGRFTRRAEHVCISLDEVRTPFPSYQVCTMTPEGLMEI
jgi:hypothetical protein